MMCGTSLDCPGYARQMAYIYYHFTTYVTITRAELCNDKQTDNFNLLFVEQ